MNYYYPTGTAMPPSQEKAGIYAPYPQPGGLPGMGVGAGPPRGLPVGYPSSNGLPSSGLGGIPQNTSLTGLPQGSSLGGLPPSSNYGGIPPTARSPVASMPTPGLSMGMSRMQPGVPNGMASQPGLARSVNGVGQPPMNGLAPSVSPHGHSAPGIPTAQLQAYPHLAGAAGFSSSSPSSIYGGSSLGSSPYSTQPMTASYPSSGLGPSSMHAIPSPYSGLSNGPSTMASHSIGPYPGGLTSYPSAMSTVATQSVYGMSGMSSLRGPSPGAPTAYPGMSPLGGSTQGPYPGQPSNAGVLRTSPLVPTPAYPANPYGRPM